MRPGQRIVRFALACTIALGCTAQAGGAGSPGAAMAQGKLLVNVRPRYEHVEQTGKSADANAVTMRTLAAWQTGAYRGFSLLGQVIDVGRANDNYNDTKNGRTEFPVVADPDDTDVNQAYVDYAGLPETRLRLGKQSIKLDNVRFIGNVEFRQVMQVFTGFTAENRSLPNTALYGGHLERLKTVNGDQQDIRLEILHAAHEWRPGNSVVGYAYLHDAAKTASQTGFADNSNRITGVRADGAWPLGEALRLLYTGEYARQRDYAGGDSRIEAGFVHVGAGLGYANYAVRVDRETLASNGGVYGFQTPLGTNHLFQGWADLFLTTPPQGIRDTWISASGPLARGNWIAEYHDFRADAGALCYGTEVDLGLAWPLHKRLGGKVELARFREDDVLPGTARKPDTFKLWITLVYSYE